MKLGIIISSNDAETVWNAFRLGVFSLQQKEMVEVFLIGKGVECEAIDTEKFDVTQQMKLFVDHGGSLLACGSCLKIRNSPGSEMCPLSSMKDLSRVIKESDRLVTF